MSKDRILIISHGHPDISKGGAEAASYNLFTELQKQKQDVYYLSRTHLPNHPGTSFSVWNKNSREIMLHTSMHDYFIFSNANLYEFTNDFTELLKTLKPSIIHFHHYLHIGLEAIRIVKNTLPNAKIILTLHEYLAICDNNGQMIKNQKNHQLCYKSSPQECANCFPNRASADYYLREIRIKSFFSLIDKFISPSNFLIERYVNWGLPKEKFIQVENPHFESKPSKSIKNKKKTRGAFAYFGQINKYKGVDVLLNAVLLLSDEIKKDFHLHIHGANLESQPQDFQEKIQELFVKTKTNVTYHGKYESENINELVEDIDWVIVPSIWWENSPMVIQEIFNCGTPIIGSNIGGIKEKTEDKGGLLFKYNNPQNLAKTIEEAMKEQIWDETSKKIKKTEAISDCIKKHLKIYFN